MKILVLTFVRSIQNLLILALATLAAPVMAQDASTPKVASVVSSGHSRRTDSVALGDEIVVAVTGATSFSQATLGQQKLILFFDGVPLDGIHPFANSVNAKGDGELRFLIEFSAPAVQYWNRAARVRKPGFESLFVQPVSVSVGPMGGLPIPADVAKFNLVLVHKSWFFGALAIVGALFLLCGVLAVKTNILRDDVPGLAPGELGPYSLARVQMAVWTLSIIASWMVMYVVLHVVDSIPDSIVALMGISAGTGIAATQVGKNRRDAGPSRSLGFIQDVLGTEAGLSFHRFQMLAWTVVVVAVFWRQVLSRWVIPEFPTSVLFLMGISSATYVGFKTTELLPQAASAAVVDPQPSGTNQDRTTAAQAG